MKCRQSLVVLMALYTAACAQNKSGSNASNAAGSDSAASNEAGSAASQNTTTGAPKVPAHCVLTTPADVNITVTSAKGPNNAAAPVAISNALYSMGIDDRTPADFVPKPDPTFTAFLKAIKPGFLRFPAGINGQHYTWSTTGAGGYPSMTPTFFDQFVTLCQQVGAQPFMAVNIENAPVSDATAMVTYANITKKYGIKWWQLGNEPMFWPPPAQANSQSNTPTVSAGETPTTYPQHYLAYRQAMLAVDPTLKFVGVESYCGEDMRGASGEPNWFDPFMDVVGSNVDAVAFHYYALYSGTGTKANTGDSSAATISNLLQESPSDWPPAGMNYANVIMPYIHNRLNKTSPNTQIWIDEYAEDSGTTLNGAGLGDVVAGALWAADTLGRYAEQGVGAIFHFIFKASQPGSNMYFGYTLLDANNVPRPEYYTFWMMANHFGDRMVATTTDQLTTVASHAAVLQADGSLHVMLTNKSEKAQNVRLTLTDFSPSSASQFVLSGSTLNSTSATLNNQTLTAQNISQGASAIAPQTAQACTDNIFSVPPASVTLIIFNK